MRSRPLARVVRSCGPDSVVALLVGILVGSLAGCAARNAVGPASPGGAARGPSTAAERDRAVQLAHALEADPFSPQAAEERLWLTRWAMEVPDITVHLCAEVLPALPPEQPFADEIMAQAIYDELAFVIERPTEARDWQAQWLHGLQGSLGVYRKIRERWPNARVAELDRLITLGEQGRLPDYVATNGAACR